MTCSPIGPLFEWRVHHQGDGHEEIEIHRVVGDRLRSKRSTGNQIIAILAEQERGMKTEEVCRS